MDVTVEVYSATGNEVLRFRTQPAYEAMFEGQYHSWYQHIEDDKVVSAVFGTHFWQDNEAQAQAWIDAQVRGALQIGWLKAKPVKKAQQLALF